MTALPPDGRTAARGLVPPLAAAGLAAGATLLVAAVDPNRPGQYLFCPFLALGGVACPLCGGLRAVHALTSGDVGLAWALNPMVLVALPLVVLGWGAWLRRARLGVAGTVLRPPVLWWSIALVVAFGIARNLPQLQPVLTPWLG